MDIENTENKDKGIVQHLPKWMQILREIEKEVKKEDINSVATTTIMR